MQTSDAVRLIRKADNLKIHTCQSVESWTGLDEDLSKFGDEEIVLFINAIDDNYEFEYEFTKNSLLQAKVKGNKIYLSDINGDEELIEIECFTEVATSLDCAQV